MALERKYGLIAGPQVNLFSKKISESLTDGKITKSWVDMADLQKYIKTHGAASIQDLEKIVILDSGMMDSKNKDVLVNQFDFLQSMFKQKELFGVYLVLYTADDDLVVRMRDHFDNNPDGKYRGAVVSHCTDGYKVNGIKRVLELHEQVLVGSDEPENTVDRERDQDRLAMEQKKKVEDNRRIQRMLGEKKALEGLKDYIDRNLTSIGLQLTSYLEEIKDDDLSMLDHDSNSDILVSEIEREMEKWNTDGL